MCAVSLDGERVCVIRDTFVNIECRYVAVAGVFHEAWLYRWMMWIYWSPSSPLVHTCVGFACLYAHAAVPSVLDVQPGVVSVQRTPLSLRDKMILLSTLSDMDGRFPAEARAWQRGQSLPSDTPVTADEDIDAVLLLSLIHI